MNTTERNAKQRLRAAREVFKLWLDGPEGGEWLKSEDSGTIAVVKFEGGNCRGVVIESRATAA